VERNHLIFTNLQVSVILKLQSALDWPVWKSCAMCNSAFHFMAMFHVMAPFHFMGQQKPFDIHQPRFCVYNSSQVLVVSMLVAKFLWLRNISFERKIWAIYSFVIGGRWYKA
jgi:hypothetical protein